MNANLKCPHCGWTYDPNTDPRCKNRPRDVVPYHDYPPPCRSVCPGSKQAPIYADDERVLGKDAS